MVFGKNVTKYRVVGGQTLDIKQMSKCFPV